MTRVNAIDLLLQVSSELMEGSKRGNVAIGNDVLRARFALMSNAEQDFDYSEAAAALRAIPSEKRTQASRANGAKGGRPRLKNVDLERGSDA